MARRKVIIEDVLALDIADKGQIIGKTQAGEVVVIEKGCVPGDTIDFVVNRKKKGLRHGFVHVLKKLSTDRVVPFCEHFGVCGGCKWQNLAYGKQLELKEMAVRQAIKKIAKEDGAKVQTIKGADQIKEYRNKLEYTFSSKRWLTNEEINSQEDYTNSTGLGFHIAGAFDKVLNLNTCHLQEDLTNKIRNKLGEIATEKGFSYYDIKNNHGFLRNIMIRNTLIGEWMVTIIFGEKNLQDIDYLFSEMRKYFPEVTSWNYMINGKMNSSTFDIQSIHVSGKDHITEVLDGISYRISPKSFFQTNSYQTAILFGVAKEFAELNKDDVVYDLYTGTGSIALFMANECKKVVGIEEIKEAIDDAILNASNNNITNAEFLVGDVKDVLKVSFKEKYGAPTVVITDPPRAGMHEEVIHTMLELAAPKIVYISCNPSTQARDIQLLCSKYSLKEVVPVDMFPHTSHIESVALLELKV